MKVQLIPNNYFQSLIINRMRPKQAADVMKKLEQHGPGCFMDVYVQSKAQMLQLFKMRSETFFSSASDHPVSFTDLLDIASRLGEVMIKGWMMNLQDGVVRDEATFSSRGVTLNGRHEKARDIQKALSLVAEGSGKALREQTYLIGRNAGLFLTQARTIANIGIYAKKSANEFYIRQNNFGQSISGILPAEKVFSMCGYLFKTHNFTELGLMQPALTPVAERAIFFRNQDDGTIDFELRLADSSEEIVNNIKGWL